MCPGRGKGRNLWDCKFKRKDSKQEIILIIMLAKMTNRSRNRNIIQRKTIYNIEE